ncbi:VanZ family protein [Corallincola platygyrae]|uniref:VanZ family protein n=1 Tax=Corallincola platygyrae TaxID=1193278 RepID=A0ABW4XRR7_9GAMM
MQLLYKISAAIAVMFFAFIVWVIYMANTGTSSVFFDFIRSIPYGDKYGHVGLFGFLTLVSVIGFKFRSFSVGRLDIYYGAALVVAFALLEELSQAFIPSRTFELIDLAADATGISCACLICFVVKRQLAKYDANEGEGSVV